MPARRVPLFGCALSLLLALPGALPAQEDLRLLVSFKSSQFDLVVDDVTETEITIYRGGALRFEQEVAFGRDGDGCASRSRFALGKGTPAQVQALNRALTAVQIGRLTGTCLLHPPNGTLSVGERLDWLGSFGDRSNTVSWFEVASPVNPSPPLCPPAVGEAREAVLAFVSAVLARPETRIVDGAACFPSR